MWGWVAPNLLTNSRSQIKIIKQNTPTRVSVQYQVHHINLLISNSMSNSLILTPALRHLPFLLNGHFHQTIQILHSLDIRWIHGSFSSLEKSLWDGLQLLPILSDQLCIESVFLVDFFRFFSTPTIKVAKIFNYFPLLKFQAVNIHSIGVKRPRKLIRMLEIIDKEGHVFRQGVERVILWSELEL